MKEEEGTLIDEAIWNSEEEEIASLVRGIDRKRIVDLVKRTQYLQRQVFAGFRPDHIPWKWAPTLLARDACGDANKVAILFQLWEDSNKELIGQVAQLHIENLREGVADLLARQGPESRERILWAIRLDDRPKVQQALKQGLAEELRSPTSPLMSYVQTRILAQELESTREELSGIKVQLRTAQEDSSNLRRLTQRKSEQIVELQSRLENVSTRKQELEGIIAELELQAQRSQNTIVDLEQQLEDKLASITELRRSVQDLKSTLRAQAEKEQADEILLALEEERREAAGVRLQLQKAEQRQKKLLLQRDELETQIAEAKQNLERMQHDKEVIIEEKRILHDQVQQLREDLEAVQAGRSRQVSDQVLAAIRSEPPEERWQSAQSEIRRYIFDLVAFLDQEELGTEVDKIALWNKWVEKETNLVYEMLTTLAEYSEQKKLPQLSEIESAQQILTLRWYLLEFTRQAVQTAELQSLLPE